MEAAVKRLIQKVMAFCLHPIWHYSPREICRLVYDDWHSHSRDQLLDHAETLLCNSKPMEHCSQQEWDRLIQLWRERKHRRDRQ